MNTKTKTNWELKVSAGLKLEQLIHLENCIKTHQIKTVSAIELVEHWLPYVNSKHGELSLYAQTDWKHIDQIVALVDQQSCKWVYVAVNKYLLYCDPDPERNHNYDQAIVEYFQKFLKNYIVTDYQYQLLNYTGDIGNFVIPDNRLLCKKTKSDC